jgi:hypothetical protein
MSYLRDGTVADFVGPIAKAPLARLSLSPHFAFGNVFRTYELCPRGRVPSVFTHSSQLKEREMVFLVFPCKNH